MGIFDFLMGNDINKGMEEFKQKDGALLLDVREKDEYVEGHIQGAKNLPLSKINRAEKTLKDKEQEIFVYCMSGSRSGQAVAYLKRMGYSNAKNIGGIVSYKGKIVR